MRATFAGLAVAVATLAVVPSAVAAARGDWPCVQRKVPEISAAAIWQGPPLDSAAGVWRTDATIAALVQLLAIRRTTRDEAAKAVAELPAASHADREARLKLVMAGLLETVNQERADVIAGLERFGAAQKKMAELLRKENAELAEVRSAANPEPAQIEQRLEQLNWNLRIFNERQKSLSSVCEVPVLIEKRLYDFSRMIKAAIDKK